MLLNRAPLADLSYLGNLGDPVDRKRINARQLNPEDRCAVIVPNVQRVGCKWCDDHHDREAVACVNN